MKATIEIIPHDLMRYDSYGDWRQTDDGLLISVSEEAEDPFLIALHELCEAELCRRAGVSEAAVDAFDLAWVQPADDPDAESGDHPDAPYRVQHRQAMMIEMLAALFLGLPHYGTVR